MEELDNRRYKTTRLPKDGSPQTKKFDKKYKGEFAKHGINPAIDLTEVDNLLGEKEQSYKKKIWDLAKMEALVHGDNQLSAVYNKMAEEGEDMYGYHYNETIMNILFNEYVMNNPRYLQKYKMAIPKEKKRRDKSGIEQLKQAAHLDDMTKQAMQPKQQVQKENDVVIHNNSLAGVQSDDQEDAMMDNNLYQGGESGTFDDSTYQNYKIEKQFDTMEEPIVHEHHMGTREEKIDFILTHKGDIYKIERLQSAPDEQIDDIYNAIEQEMLGVEETSAMGGASGINNAGQASYASPEAFAEGKEETPTVDREEEEVVDETTTSASSGQYTGPFGKKKGKKKGIDTPFWDGGEVIGESDYLTDPSGFKKYLNEMDEFNIEAGLESPNNDSLVPVSEDINDYPLPDELLNQPSMTQGLDMTQVPTEMLKRVQQELGANAKKFGASPNMNNLMQQIQKFLGMNEAAPNTDAVNTWDLQNKASGAADDKLSTLTKGSRKKMPMSQLVAWARQNNIGSMDAAQATPLVQNLMTQLNLDSNKFIDLLEMYLSDSGYEGFAQTPEQEALEDLRDMAENMSAPMAEKAESIAQKNFMYAAKDAKENPDSKVTGDAAEAGESMSLDQIEDFTDTPSKGLPDKVDEMNPLVGAAVSGAAGAVVDKVMGESMVDEIPDSMANKNGQPKEGSMANYSPPTAPTGGGEMMEGVDIEDNNPLGDFGKSGKADVTHGTGMNIPHAHEPIEAPTMKKLATESTEIEEDVSQRTKCKSDEEPVKGKRVNEKGGCKKKATMAQNSEDKYNTADRRKRLSKYEKELAAKKGEYSKELEKNKNHMDKLKNNKKEAPKKKVTEDRKPSALVMKDRLGKENKANFNSDLADSNTEMLKVKQDELTAKEQITQVPENPYELAQKIEKEHLATNDGLAFSNVGDSANEKGDEIPKRNLTSDEEELLNLYRKGQHSWNYDSEPSKRFVARMKKDMGEEVFELMKKQMEFIANAPMYNKDTQPINYGEDKAQFDKYESGWNEKRGLNMEGAIAGKYKDEFGKTKLINFNAKNSELVESVEGLTPINLDGMGNSYTTRVEENTNMRAMMDAFKFYVNGEGKVKHTKSGVQSLNEGETEKKPINEEYKKMMKLAGYDPSKHTNTSNVKKNRGF